MMLCIIFSYDSHGTKGGQRNQIEGESYNPILKLVPCEYQPTAGDRGTQCPKFIVIIIHWEGERVGETKQADTQSIKTNLSVG